MVVVVEEEGIENANTQFGHQGFCSCRSRCHSIHVNPGTIPVEFEFHSTFRQNSIINLAGPCAKIDSSGIPGIAWRTIKTLYEWGSYKTKFATGGMPGEDPWVQRWRGRRWVQIGLSARQGFLVLLYGRVLYRFQTLYQWVGDP